jgi:glyceraldehyde 3-phosphate dehydrogenase
VLPELVGKLNGLAMRVPVTNVSVTDLVVNTKKSMNADSVNAAYKGAMEGDLKGILDYTEEPLVSSDYIHNPHSVTIDGLSTIASGNTAKVIGWYDNEWGYSCRLAWMTEKIGRLAG